MATNLLTVMMKIRRCGRVITILFYTKRGKLQVNISQQLGGVRFVLFKVVASKLTGIPINRIGYYSFGYTQIKRSSLGSFRNYSKSRGQPDADQVFALNFPAAQSCLLPWRSNDGYTGKKCARMTSNTSIDNEGHITQNPGFNGDTTR